MPPRKKAAPATKAAPDTGGAADVVATDVTTTRATRSSARTRAAAAKVDAPDPVPAVPALKTAAKPKSKGKAPASKANGKGKKRARDDEDEDEGKADEGEPDTKKTKQDLTDVVEEEDEDDEPPKKMVTIVKRGAAPVDPCSGMVDSHQVYTNDEGVWDAMLNQTDIGKNANKFYVIQLLHPIGNPSSCMLFTRWGRVGENGQQMKKGAFDSSHAVLEFKKQFKAKAATDWELRHGMVAKKGKYQWIERAFEDDDDKEDKSGSSSKGKDKIKEEPEKIPDSKLPLEIQALCKLMFSTKLIDAHLSSMNYDAHKLPLGKLAKSTILNGFAALKELDLVDALGDMEVASKLIASSVGKDEDGNPLNPIDAHFSSLRLSSMEPIGRKTKEFGTLETYVRETHGTTHHIKVDVLNAFRVERQDETDAWMKAGNDSLKDGERLLLWHGSRTTNFAGILKQGLRIAPPEAPVTGYMFGKGVYFADMMSKSANYCYSYLSENTGLLLLCEVAAQPFYERKNAEYNADVGCKAAGARATKGLGRTQPSAWQDAGSVLDNEALKGVHMPKGAPKDVNEQGVYLQYNEYIVYDPSQIRLRYLLMVKME
ncbi:hypothetical protein EW026_g2179 [Hermanssonia centrifuga]|uniref:Poly [ADP-ribose] polymerase n=1 Tax=Hermanssonia centrifuga TaxID=98765 RepID=A0A4S4KP46_9APHY|nr:hypothetical protein EW026_g2179 [Hermanssonia centrifuga]